MFPLAPPSRPMVRTVEERLGAIDILVNKRAEWAELWCNEALKAKTAIDFWRHEKLAEGVVDRRICSVLS